MTAHRARIRGPLALVLSILALAAPAVALDAQAGESVVSRPLATRAELDAAAARLAREPGADARSARATALRRLTDGDFGPGALRSEERRVGRECCVWCVPVPVSTMW